MEQMITQAVIVHASRSLWRGLAVLVLLGLPAALCAAEEAKISVALSQSEIYEGQSVEYQVTVDNVENPPTPELRGLPDFAVVFLGQRPIDFHMTSNINGIITREDHHGSKFHFRLTPTKTGEFVIPSPEITIDGKKLSGEKLRLVVQPPTAQDLALVELTADRREVYPTQPFTVTLSVFVKELPAPLSDREHLSLLTRRRPVLRISWLTEVPAGLTAREDWQDWVRKYIDRDGVGFGLNDIVQQSALSLFGDRETIAFRPRPQTAIRRDAQGQEVKYRRYDFQRAFTAKQAGAITLAAVTLQGPFVSGIDYEEQLAAKSIFAASKPLTITVKDVPQDSQPDDYLGAIGRYHLEAELTPRKSKVGDPLTFTLVLSGSGSLAAVKPLDLAKVPGVAERFKVYEATQKTAGDSARFVYALRPLAAGEEPFPAVTASYFDVDQGRYATLRSDPIPVDIGNAEQLSAQQIVASPGAAGQMSKDLEARREGIFANITDVAAVRDQGVRPLAWLGGLGGCLGTYLVVAAVATFARRRMQDTAALRRRAAAPRARQQLRDAVAKWQARQVREAADRVQDSFAGLVADVANLPDAGLTPKDVLRQLREWSVEETLVARTGHLLEACDAARYGGAAASGDLCEEASQVLDTVIAALRRQRRLR